MKLDSEEDGPRRIEADAGNLSEHAGLPGNRCRRPDHVSVQRAARKVGSATTTTTQWVLGLVADSGSTKGGAAQVARRWSFLGADISPRVQALHDVHSHRRRAREPALNVDSPEPRRSAAPPLRPLLVRAR